jgi:hypothetical protein
MSSGKDTRSSDSTLKWGVSAKPLPRDSKQQIRTGVGAQPSATPTRPPRGGSALPPAPEKSTKR